MKLKIVLATLVLLAMMGTALASTMDTYVSALDTAYGLTACTTCHNNDYSRNAYGKFFEAVPYHTTDPFGALCSIGAPAGATKNTCPVKVTFMVTDSTTGSAINGATVAMDGIRIQTDTTGTAVFTNVAQGDHKYTVSMRGYKRNTGNIIGLTSDKTVQIQLVHR